MKKVLSIALVLSGISFLSLAQESPMRGKQSLRVKHQREIVQKSPEEIAKLRTDRMTKELSLTDNQRQEMYALQLNKAQKREQALVSAKKQREERRAEIIAEKEQMNSILTPEQQKLITDKKVDSQKNNKKRLQEKRKRSNREKQGRFLHKRSKSTLENTSND